MRAMSRFANDSQMQSRILNDMVVMNDPRFRPFFLFKRFGYRQAVYMKDMLKRETLRGNPMPMVRLAAAGFLGGAGTIWAVNQIQHLLTGEPLRPDDKDKWYQQMANNLTTIGAFGVLGDMLNLDGKLAKMPENLKRAFMPVVLSDAEKIIDAATKVGEDWDRYGDAWLTTRRNAYNVFTIMGTYPAALSKRLMTQDQRDRRLSQIKGGEVSAVRDLILSGDGQRAADRIAEWNSSHKKEEALNHDDVSMKSILKYVETKERNYLMAKDKTVTVKQRGETKKVLSLEGKKELRRRIKEDTKDMRANP
jgi:hypothetical protein